MLLLLYCSLHELRQSFVVQQKYEQVLQQAMQFMVAFPTYGGCFVLISGWEALFRVYNIRYKIALKVVRKMKLDSQKLCQSDLRKANQELLMHLESCAASQLGLYKVQAWQKRLEHRGERYQT